MSKAKPDDTLSAVVEPARSELPAGEGVVFRDQLYTSRTLILQSGRAAVVAKGCITANDNELFDYLTTHPEFKPAE